MASFNKVMLIGNLTRDPELKYTPKGTAVVEIGLAVNRTYTADNGEKREEVTFIDVTLWSRVAEIVAEYCKKGRPLFVEGRLHLDTWDDKQTGTKRSKLRVVGENIQLLGSREGGGGGGGPSGGGEGDYGAPREPREPRGESRPASGARPPTRPSSPPPPRPPVDPDLDAPEDDIPF